jgi:tetratricopeptide (TPR) repeat protein
MEDGKSNVSYTQEMKRQLDFWTSLEQYGWKVAKRSPLPWYYVGLGLVGMSLLFSALNVKNSMVGEKNLQQVIEKAAEKGDYSKAQELWESYEHSPKNIQGSELVLGTTSEIEDKIYPEKVVERRLIELTDKLNEYPENKEVYLELARLYEEIGKEESAQEYFELARVLDPNGIEFQ